jgi:undecaprenyl-diphosphatase
MYKLATFQDKTRILSLTRLKQFTWFHRKWFVSQNESATINAMGGPMDLQFVEFIQSFRTDVLDVFFSLITELGDETVFIVVVGLVYWTISKPYGYKYAMVFLTSVVLNESLKELIRRPRPFTTPNVTSVVPETTGYSMPSGHAQNSTMQALLLNERFGALKRWVRPVLTIIVLLVSFSRIYLGQHYASDVIAGVAVAALLYVLLQRAGKKVSLTGPKAILFGSPVLLLLLLLLPEKNIWISVAGIVGGTIGYVLEERFVRFDVRAPLLLQGLKFLIGISITLGLQEGLKLVLPYANAGEMGTLILDFIRYALLVMWVTLGAPATFKLLFQRKAA